MANIPTLSIIVPTVMGPERWRSSIQRLNRQALQVDAEIVLATSRPYRGDDLGDAVTIVGNGASDVFELRTLGLRAARGRHIALLEDHVAVGDDWCSRVLEAFAEHPDADGIVGGMSNGAHRCLDRASFLLTWGPFLAPLDDVPLDRSPPPGAISFRSEAIPTGDYDPGFLEYELPCLLRDRERLIAAPRVEATHIQYVGLRGFSLQFHAGVAYAGLNSLSVSRASRAKRLCRAAALPRMLVQQTSQGLARVGVEETLACRVLYTLMAAANAAGQAVGIVRGSVGGSPSHLE